MYEIERKFVIGKIPEKIIKENMRYNIEQGYLNIDPELRIRLVLPHDMSLENAHSQHVLTIKSNGDISRKEIDIVIDHEEYDNLLSIIEETNKKESSEIMIYKEYYSHDEDGHVIEVSIVDKGTPHQFIYVEVEFDSIIEADDYVFPLWFLEDCGDLVEVTYDENYKMKNYWKNTRLRKDTDTIKREEAIDEFFRLSSMIAEDGGL